MATRFRWLGKTLGMLLCVAAIVAILAWLMGAFEEKVPPGREAPKTLALPAGAKTIVARIESVPVTESAVGTVHPVHRISVGSKLLARVKVMHVEKAGVHVHAGDVLVELDDSDLRAQLAQAQAARDAAQAARDQARIELGRTRKLHEQKVESKAALDTAETHLTTAEANLTRAEQAVAFARSQLSYTVVKSPIDGIVIDKLVETGDLVTPGRTLVALYDPGRMQLVARVRERLAMRLKPGQEVAVSIEALSLDCEGTIDQIVPEAESSSRVFEVRVVGPCPPGIYAGMFGRLYVPVGTRREMRIPAQAVRHVGQMETVFVVQAGDGLRRRFVQTGRAQDGRVEVLAGLREGETILANAGDVE
jgi:RND family efflux transporter MFP subunit